MPIKKGYILAYDQSAIVDNEIDFRMENWKDRFGEKPSRDVIANEVYQDSDIFQFAWDDLVADLTFLMKNRNPGGHWHAEVKNFGWQSRSGHKDFHAVNGADFLREILPDTDNTFFIHQWGKKGFAIQNFHHDSPTGNEWYYVKPQKSRRS